MDTNNALGLNLHNQMKYNVVFGLSLNNSNKNTFGEEIGKDDAIKVLVSRHVDSQVIEALKNTKVEVRAFAKPWLSQELADKTLYFFNN